MMLVVADPAVESIVVDAWGRRFHLTPDGPRTTERVPAPVSAPASRPVALVTSLILEVAEEVAHRSGVSVSRMRGPFRHPEVARARMVAMWMAHARHDVHPAELGIFFRRHRTTVLHALGVVDEIVRDGFAGHPAWRALFGGAGGERDVRAPTVSSTATGIAAASPAARAGNFPGAAVE